MNRRRFLRSFAVVASLAFAACGTAKSASSSSTPAKSTKVTIVLDWTPNTNHSGIYLAQAKGYYRDAGLDVSIIEPGNGGGLPQLAAGNAQFAVSVAEELLPARAQGARVVSVAAILQHNTSSLIVPASRNIARPRDLAGKTYGGFGGDLEKALVDAMVTCDGGDPGGVKYVEIGNTDYKIGLDRRDFDAVWVFDGWDVIRLEQLDGMKLVTFPFHDPGQAGRDCIPDWYTPLIATTDDLIARQPDLVARFVQATARGYELARSDPQTAVAALLAAAPELDKALVNKSAQYLATKYADTGQPWGRQDAAVWATFEQFLVAHKILSTPVDTTKVFTNQFLPKS
ncbi:MAG: ABC transporter substrate-binding protein [Acidimicrobiales bacterium]